MNSKQKLALLLGVVVIALMGIYPPWKEVGVKGLPLEYGVIFSPPRPLNPDNGLEIDFGRLLLQVAVASILTGGLMAAAGESKSSATGSRSGSASTARTADSLARPGEERADSPRQASPERPASPVSAITDEEIRLLELSAAVEADVVVVRLPTSKSYGEFLVESVDEPDYWEHHAQARGAVKLPVGRRVQLEVKGDDDVDLSFVSVLEPNAIHSIDLSESKVRDWELANLAKLVYLRELDLSGTGVSSQAIGYISALTSLEKLWLDETQIDDACLADLKQFTCLKKLSLKNTRLSSDGVNALKEALSDCQIES